MTTIESLTKSQRREHRDDLRDAINEINEEIASKLDEIATLKAEVEALREQRAWRVEALKALRASV